MTPPIFTVWLVTISALGVTCIWVAFLLFKAWEEKRKK